MNKKLNNYLTDEKPYEKVLKNGAESLSDAEALAVILRTGYKDLDVLTLARNVLKKAGGSLIGIHVPGCKASPFLKFIKIGIPGDT